MSSLPAATMPHSLAQVGAHGALRKRLATTGLSLNGVLLFLIGLSVLSSGSMNTRIYIMGQAAHPYLIAIGLMFPVMVASRSQRIPMSIMTWLWAFTAIYCFSVFLGRFEFGEILKMVSAPVTIITMALLVNKRGDFVAAALGLCLAVALLTLPALAADERKPGLLVMEGVANKNSYSLYALPAILLGGFVALNMKAPKIVHLVIVVCAILSVAAIFMTGNRSGYLGAALVGLMLLWDRKGKGLLVVGVVVMAVVYVISNFGSASTMNVRLNQTFEGTVSDTSRKQLVAVCFAIALENPVMGVGPLELPYEIGKNDTMGYHRGVSEAHNVVAHVVGGSGFLALGCFLMVGVALWRAWPIVDRGGAVIPKRQDPLRQARRLMRSLVVLYFVRGMFTAEILFNPPFNMAIGLCIALCVMAEQERAAMLAGARPAAGPPPRLVPGYA